MVKMINQAFGTEMWVAEDRVEEYMAAGHKLAVSNSEDQPEKRPKAARRKQKKEG